MSMDLIAKNKSTGWYEGKCTCYVCDNEYQINEALDAKLVAERPGRYDSDGYYVEFAVYSKCPHCKYNNKHYREAKIDNIK